MEGSPVLEVVETPLGAEEAIRADAPLPEALPVLPLRETVTFPETLTPLAVGQDRSKKLIDDVLGGNRMLVMVASRDPDNDEPGHVRGVAKEAVGERAHRHRLLRLEQSEGVRLGKAEA
jgi:ATP-dependent Lon protease